ncbi:N-acetylmuramoyl-L-alanine amidase [Anoxybacterium hadale]|uniref:N-acetylmuramoyl-L-alanine amidase n=1 Tax=Anoxybacterium hadale TaxID=3408580 RepID=A0ACD1A795_9FIRM|nr:N-acetylmuramoyl-L-alanine amidase [Clostridiales bacterium]
MPKIYLSPTVQDNHSYIIDGDEEYYMNLIVDAMVPYLRENGIEFQRCNPGNTLAQIIQQSNSGNFDLHIALRSNSAPEDLQGVLRGPDVYYQATSTSGRKAAGIIGENLREIYPVRKLIATIPTTIYTELKRTSSPAVLIKLAYHDNFEDAQWIRNNINPIAENIVKSLTELFDSDSE